MNYYKVLGIEENATQEEIKEAYNRQVQTFKEEVKDEKRLEKFLDLFKEAYDALNYEESIVQNQMEEIFDEEVSALFKKNKIEEKPVDISLNKDEVKVANQNIENSYAATVLMSREEILKESLIQHHEPEEERIIFKSKEDFEECDVFFDDDDEEEDFEEKIIKKIKQKNPYKKNKNSSSIKRNSINKNNKEYNSRDRDRDRDNIANNEYKEKNKKVVVKKEKNSSLLLIPLKILVLPVIVILSILIFICKIISISSWLVSKVIIVGAIAIAAIHGYRIYIGQVAREYNIFVACGIGFIVSIFLPSIVRIVPNTLQGINNSLKDFVF
ncbi:J domain-containing protein [Clostridium cuniculi]|uniref:J domain-containing protein n=1 Tax=Clostridium cuniculi TaxID=2548455 RepID=UPI001054AB0D|nr:DnaJ domain-containing protein [Clostridium cuniculi]